MNMCTYMGVDMDIYMCIDMHIDTLIDMWLLSARGWCVPGGLRGILACQASQSAQTDQTHPKGTCTRARSRSHGRMSSQLRTSTHTGTCTSTHTGTRSQVCTHTHTCTRARMHTCVCTHACAHKLGLCSKAKERDKKREDGKHSSGGKDGQIGSRRG